MRQGSSFRSLTWRALVRTFSYSGRSSRSELVAYSIVAMLVVPITTFGLMFAGLPTTGWVGLGLSLLVTSPFPALLTRRVHDHGRSGWWVLPAAGAYSLWLLRSIVSASQGFEARIALDQAIWPLDWAVIAANTLTIVLVCLPGTRGPNRFGPDPCE